MTPSQDRAVIKKKIKEMRSSIERARKAQEKMEKQREKLRKKEKEQLQRKSKKPEKRSPDPTDGASEQWCIRVTILLGSGSGMWSKSLLPILPVFTTQSSVPLRSLYIE